MQKIFVPSQSISVYKGVVLRLLSDLTISADKTWARGRAAMPNNVIIDVLLFGKKGQDGKNLPIEENLLDAAKKGVAIRVPDAFLGINPTEKDGKTYENKSLRFTEFEPYQLPVLAFSGRVVGEIKAANLPDGTPVHEFRLAQYRGKNEDGTYKPSHFETVRIYGELPAIVKEGAQLVVEGPYLSNPREVTAQDGSVKKYDNTYIAARDVKESKPFFLVLDDNGNVVGKEPYVEQPKAETEQVAAAAPAEPTYEPAPVVGDMPY